MKLLLEAFQMALAAWGLRPEAAMLRAQMASRLIAAAYDSAFLSSWLAQQRVAADAAASLLADAEPQQQQETADQPPQVQCLVAATASLTQAGGLHRMLLRGHAAPLTCMLLSPTGIDLVTGEPVLAWSTASTTDVCCSNLPACCCCSCVNHVGNNRIVALADLQHQPVLTVTASFCVYATGDEAGGLRVWDLELGDCTNVLAGHCGGINALATAPGSVLVSASSDGTCRVWDLQQGGACCCMLVGHIGSVKAVAVEPRGRFCVTAGADGSARVWSLTTAACALVLQDSVDFDPPGPCSSSLFLFQQKMHSAVACWALSLQVAVVDTMSDTTSHVFLQLRCTLLP